MARRFVTAWGLQLGALAAVFFGVGEAQAAPPLARLLELPAARVLFGSPSGEEAMRRVLRLAGETSALGKNPSAVAEAWLRASRAAPDYEIFARALTESKDPGVRMAARDLRPMLEEMQGALQEYRAMTHPDRLHVPAESALTVDELTFVSRFGRARLRLNEGFLAENPVAMARRPGDIEFLHLEPQRSVTARFLSAPTPEDLARVRQAIERENHSILAEMNACIRQMSTSERRSARQRSLVTQLKVSQTFTAGGHLLDYTNSECRQSAGDALKNWATDAAIGFVNTAVSAHMGSDTRHSVGVRYLRVAAVSAARATVDLAVYLVTPFKDTKGKSVQDFVIDRWLFASAWAAFSPTITVSLMHVLTGAECLMANGAPGVPKAWIVEKLADNRTLAQYAQSAANTAAFFTLRRHATGEERACVRSRGRK
jgi:hypothetical protein